MIVRIQLTKMVALFGVIAFLGACTTGAGSNPEVDSGVTDNAQTSGEASGKSAGDVNASGNTPAKAANDTEPSSEPASEGSMYVQPWSLSVRQGPGMEHPVIKHLARGAAVSIMGTEGVWAQIGEKEYVSKRFLGADKPE